MLEEELYIICKKKNMTWLKMFKIFNEDGFGVIKSNKNEFSLFVIEFNCFRKNIIRDKWHFGNMVASLLLWTFKF